jgi:hypothetical protein
MSAGVGPETLTVVPPDECDLQWTVMGDLREIVNFDRESTNYIVGDALKAEGFTDLDPEFSCFFGYAINEAEAIKLRDAALRITAALVTPVTPSSVGVSQCNDPDHYHDGDKTAIRDQDGHDHQYDECDSDGTWTEDDQGNWHRVVTAPPTLQASMLRDEVWEIIEDILDSIKLAEHAERSARWGEAAAEDLPIYTTVRDYVGNTYGED